MIQISRSHIKIINSDQVDDFQGGKISRLYSKVLERLQQFLCVSIQENLTTALPREVRFILSTYEILCSYNHKYDS